MRRVPALVMTVALVAPVLAGCSKKEPVAAPTTTTSTTTTSTTTTTVAPTTTTIPVAPPPTDVELTVPSTVPVSRKTGEGPCVDKTGTQYCVWGSYPIDRTVNNSRRVVMDTGVRQGFTAVSKRVKSVELVLESTTIGALVPATETTTNDQVCVRVSLMSSMGLPIATMGLVTSSTRGVRQTITVPLESAVVKGALNKLEIQKGPACAAKDLATYFAMSSDYKYPKAFGRASVDGKSSTGSLWARVN